MCAILEGVRPPRPSNYKAIGLTDEIWDLVQACWDPDRGTRPLIKEVVERVGNAAASWRTLIPPSGRVSGEPTSLQSNLRAVCEPGSIWLFAVRSVCIGIGGNCNQPPSEDAEFYSVTGTHPTSSKPSPLSQPHDLSGLPVAGHDGDVSFLYLLGY